MTEPTITCKICDSADINPLHRQANRNVYQCNMCVFTWTDYQPWRGLPITEQQAAWLEARGLDCDGTRGHAADMIGDRIPWRNEAPTYAQLDWFEARGLMAPKTAGDAAEMMMDWQKRMKERG